MYIGASGRCSAATKRKTANMTCSSLGPKSATCFGGWKDTEGMSRSEIVERATFGSLGAGILTNREGKRPKDAFFSSSRFTSKETSQVSQAQTLTPYVDAGGRPPDRKSANWATAQRVGFQR